MKPVRLLIVNIVFLIAGLAYSQDSRQKVTQDVQWFSISSELKFSKRFGLFLDGQLRYAQSLDNMQQQFRTAFYIYANKQLTLSPLGYVYVWNHKYGEQPVSVVNNEHRIYQQVQYKHSTGKFYFSHRFRTEERFIQSHTNSPVDGYVDEGYGDNFQFRIRHRVWVNMPLAGKKIEKGSWYLASYLEGFMSWGKKVTYDNKIDQCRAFMGLGYQFLKNTNVQAGPFYQYLIKAQGAQQENNVGIFVHLNYNFDFSKPDEVK